MPDSPKVNGIGVLALPDRRNWETVTMTLKGYWLTMTILHGDCLDVCKTLEPETVNLIVTSPPYADRRKGKYEGVPASEYVQWFLPRAEEFKRVLRPDGSLVLNLKEHIERDERSTYVIELILGMTIDFFHW